MTREDARQFLTARGVPPADAAAAVAADDGTLPLLVLDAMLFPDPARYDEASLMGQAGVERDYARTLWRAMGFPMVPEGSVAFYEDDLAALRNAMSQDSPIAPLAAERVGPSILHQTRVMSAALSRIAEQSIDSLSAILAALRAEGLSDVQIADVMIESFHLGQFEDLLWYLFRRQLRAAAWRRLARPADASPSTIVGFIDLVRFAAITEEVADDELEVLVERFEQIAHDTIAEHGGRVVKMIGDAVMFVAESPESAVDVALELVDAYARDALLPPARAGLAEGPALVRDGDYYGPTVNLAARIVDIARPSSVVVSEQLERSLSADGRFSFRRLPPKRLKGIGRATLYKTFRR